MKKLINDPNDVVVEALLGVEAAHPEIQVDHANKIIYRGDAPKPGKVGIISGGGSGHEPLHGGFVGLGMLDAACAGEMFTSPVPDQMLAATKLVDGGAGVPRSSLWSPTTTSRSRTAPGLQGDAAWGPPCSWRRSPEPPPSRAGTSMPWLTSRVRSTLRLAAWASR